MKKISIVIVMVFLSFFLMSCASTKCYTRVTILKGVNFDTEKATLKKESYPVLDENIETIKSHPKMTITIVGHTDNEGTTAYNKKLSEDRANTVMRYFAKKGITADRMRAIGKGDTTPIANNSKAAGRAQNRRIEIEFADPEPNVVCK